MDDIVYEYFETIKNEILEIKSEIFLIKESRGAFKQEFDDLRKEVSSAVNLSARTSSKLNKFYKAHGQIQAKVDQMYNKFQEYMKIVDRIVSKIGYTKPKD